MKNGNYQISDVAGKTLAKGMLVGHTSLDVNSLAPGLYLLQTTGDGKRTESFKFTKE